jgi:hypothetical protein
MTSQVRVTLRLPEALHQALEEAAEKDGRSLNGMIVRLLDLGLVGWGTAREIVQVAASQPPAQSRSKLTEMLERRFQDVPADNSLSRPAQGQATRAAAGAADLDPVPRSSACPMLVPKGTRCKSCGKVH